MDIAHTIAEARRFGAAARAAGRTVGLVPTMGALHEGHYSLIRRCRTECSCTIVSIFVNPAQFGPAEDFAGYPRPFDADTDACRRLGTDLLFAPESREMYPRDQLAWANVEKLTRHLCGTRRPDHYRGVCTVVLKLCNILTPARAYFGQKDAQQLAVIQRLAADLNLGVEIVPCPTVREPDGLALSSRNRYLSHDQRRQAPCLCRALFHARDLLGAGQTDSAAIIAAMTKLIQEQPQAQIDYISIVDRDLLQPIPRIDRPALIALAVHLGPARLIDNLPVDPPPAKTLEYCRDV